MVVYKRAFIFFVGACILDAISSSCDRYAQQCIPVLAGAHLAATPKGDAYALSGQSVGTSTRRMKKVV